MTEMLQKTENVAKNVANENSQDLTEQWKKGELPEGHYYVKDGENMIAEYLDGYFYNDGNPMTSFSGGVDEVLAPVPSYDELQNMNKAVNECMAANIKLVEENKQLKERVSKLEKMQYSYTPEEWNTMLRTVNRTKELLKECKTPLEVYNEMFGNKEELLTKIDEVLK